MVKIDLEKRDFIWAGLVVVLLGAVFVVAYNSNMDVGTPSVMGHSAGEVDIDVTGDGVADKSLQAAIDAGDLGGGSATQLCGSGVCVKLSLVDGTDFYSGETSCYQYSLSNCGWGDQYNTCPAPDNQHTVFTCPVGVDIPQCYDTRGDNSDWHRRSVTCVGFGYGLEEV